MSRFGLVAVGAVAVLFLSAGCGGDGDEPAEHGAGPEAGSEIAQKTCPVMEGNKINPKLFVDHEGRRIYFCCKMCVATFKKNPAKYIKKVDAQIAKPKAAVSSGEEHDAHEGHAH